MGCSGSKSTPVIEPGIDQNKNTMTTNGTITKNHQEDFLDNGYDGAQATVETKPNTPETERVVDSNGAEEVEKVVQELDDIINRENQHVEKAEDSALPEKPLTPMPEAVIMNAQWPNISHESKDQSDEKANVTPSLDPIEEEKRYVDSPSEDGPVVIEILTLEISEIPLANDRVMEQNNNSQDEDEEKNKEEKEEETDKEKPNEESET